MSFKKFIIDGKVFACKKTGCPDVIRNSVRKDLTKGEVIHEKEFLAFVKRSPVTEVYKDTETYKYLIEKFPKLCQPDLSALGRMIARVFNLSMPREVYRRMITTMYWFIMNWGTLSYIFSHHEIIGVHAKWGKIHFDSPDARFILPIIVPSKSDKQKAVQNE